MITTLLFDLDNTLLDNSMDTFVPAYLELLARHLVRPAEGRRLMAEVLQGTQAMLANTDPARNLLAVFNDYFFPAMGWDEKAQSPRLADFYQNIFPQLRPQTRPCPAARAVMQWAFAGGYEVVIATSPFFPLRAIEERLRWAGLADFAYARITGAENSHFTKPHPEYLAEILAHLGRLPENVLCIGNDWADDLRPAAQLGIPHYGIAPAGAPPPGDDGAHPLGVSDLAGFLNWAQRQLKDFQPPPAAPTVYPTLLTGDLAAVVGVLEDLPEAAWRIRPAEKEWSLTELACHLRDVEREVHGPRVQAILQQDDPFLVGTDTDTWVSDCDYQTQSGPEALQAFVAARKQSIAVLADLAEAAWRRPARHTIFGPTHLAEIVGWILEHDRIHIAQLRQTRQSVTRA